MPKPKAGPSISLTDQPKTRGVAESDVPTRGGTTAVTRSLPLKWFSGDGPPQDPVIGASPGDYYMDNLTGELYRLT